MIADPKVIVLGEDVHGLRLNLYIRFGAERVRSTPISESAFVGAAVTAAMAGLRPVVELIVIDFLGVAMDAMLNHAAKIDAFTGGKWQVPMVLRASCGGGYGDAGQHEQALWGWLAHIPGLSIVVPSTPEDAGSLMLAAVQHDGPVIFLEHKLLADYWLDHFGYGGRTTVQFDIPDAGAFGPVPDRWQPLPLGKAIERKAGDDLTIVTVGVTVHRALEAAMELQKDGIAAGVIDLRTVTPLDEETVINALRQSGRLLVVDEDYERFGLSGELAAVALEAGLQPRFARVCTQQTIPYARHLEDQVLPSKEKITAAARKLVES
jgi:pyruvate dehydrogenase E1 component beta subunit